MTRKLNHKARRALMPKPGFGNRVSFSQRHTSRQFKPNLQWVTVMVDGNPVRLQLSARQIRTLVKEESSGKLLVAIKKAVS